MVLFFGSALIIAASALIEAFRWYSKRPHVEYAAIIQTSYNEYVMIDSQICSFQKQMQLTHM